MLLRRTLFTVIFIGAIGFVSLLGLVLLSSYSRVRTWQTVQERQLEDDRVLLKQGGKLDSSDIVQRSIAEDRAQESIVELFISAGIALFLGSLTFTVVGVSYRSLWE